MQLFHEWKDSLSFFSPKKFKLFGLAAMNTAWQAYKVWYKYFWPLFVVYGLTGFVGMASERVFGLLVAVLHFTLFVSLILSIRPSVARKTPVYFSRYWLHSLILAILFFIDYFVSLEHLRRPLLKGDDMFNPFFSLAFATVMLFYFDTRGQVRDFFVACWRTLKLVWYGLPFYCVMMAATGVVFGLLRALINVCACGGLGGIFYALLGQVIIILFSVIPLSCVAIFYTKKIHDYSESFFG